MGGDNGFVILITRDAFKADRLVSYSYLYSQNPRFPVSRGTKWSLRLFRIEVGEVESRRPEGTQP